MVALLPQRTTAGINQKNRCLLELLHRHTTGIFDAEEAAQVLGIGPAQTRQLLIYLARQGWLARVKRGLYIPVPLGAGRSDTLTEDPWILAKRMFGPCYIGGWSACAHWGLTEHESPVLTVVTSRQVRRRNLKVQTVPFHLTVRTADTLFGTTPVSRKETSVLVSNASRTIADILNTPSLGGGIRMVSSVINEYLGGTHRDDDLLVEYCDRLGNRAAFKRLGYLLERSKATAPELTRSCLERRSSGLVALDPSMGTRGKIVRRWGLRVNDVLGPQRGEPAGHVVTTSS